MYISLNNIISKRFYDYDKNKWRKMYRKTKIKMLDLIKEKCGINNDNLTIDNLPGSYGIFDRVTTDGYIAGQDYPSELRFVKNLIKKEC